MPKEKKEETVEQFQISESAFDTGYHAKIDGRTFNITRGKYVTKPDPETGNDARVLEPGKVYEDGVFSDQKYFEDLTFLQKHELTQAGVIILTPEQAAEYNNQLAEFYKK